MNAIILFSIAKLSHVALGGSTHRTSFVQFWGKLPDVLRKNQNMSVNLKMVENIVETFTETGISVSKLRPVICLNRNNIFNCRVVFGYVEAIKI